MRLYSSLQLLHQADFSIAAARMGLWSVAEVATVILTGAFPILPQFFKTVITGKNPTTIVTSTRAGGYHYRAHSDFGCLSPGGRSWKFKSMESSEGAAATAAGAAGGGERSGGSHGRNVFAKTLPSARCDKSPVMKQVETMRTQQKWGKGIVGVVPNGMEVVVAGKEDLEGGGRKQ